MTTHAPYRALHGVKAFVLAISACAALVSASTSQAQTFYGDDFTFTEAQFNALGVTAVPIAGTQGDTFITYQTSAGTQTLTFTNNGNGTSQYIQRRDQKGTGTGAFGGNFPDSTPLVRNVVGSRVSNPADGLVITFSNPVSAFGFNYDPTLSAAFTDFTFDVFEGGASPAFSTTTSQDVNTGNPPTRPGDMTAPFFGVSVTGGNLITGLRIVGAPTNPPVGGTPTNTTPNDFAVGLLRFKISPQAPPNVPEPGSIALLMGMAVTGMSCFARRKQRTAGK